MPFELEVRRGRVEPIASNVHVSGSEVVSSSTVTTFELDGRVVEFSGSTLPFRPGDEAVVAGQVGGDGVFYAYAIRLPAKGLTFGGSSVGVQAFGGIFVVAGIGMTIAMVRSLFGMGWEDWPFPAFVPVVLGLAFGTLFPAAGLSLIRQSRRAIRARELVRAPATKPAVA